jgi:hypothetical protein
VPTCDRGRVRRSENVAYNSGVIQETVVTSQHIELLLLSTGVLFLRNLVLATSRSPGFEVQ